MENLFEKLKDKNIFDAYLVIKNQLNKDVTNKEIFEKFIETGITLSKLDVEFNYRRQIASEMLSAFRMFSESIDIDEDMLSFIKNVQKRIDECWNKIDDDENEFLKKFSDKKEDENRQILSNLSDLLGKLKNATDQKQFDELLESVSKIDVQLDKDSFNTKQEDSYNSLTKAFSKTISEKMEQLNRQELLEYNKVAVKHFKEVFDSFKNNISKYKERNNLKNLLTKKFFIYDTSKLFNETLIYYNNVYNMIFQEVDNDLKFAVTEWALNTKKLRSDKNGFE